MTEPGRIASSLQHATINTAVLSYILAKVNRCCEKATECYRLERLHEAKSAQQQVFILHFALEESSSVQWKDHVTESLPNDLINLPTSAWIESLRNGGNRLVLRIWRGGSQWWNLHQNGSPLDLAKGEVMGYRVARQALLTYSSTDLPRIPQVLMFENGGLDKNNPWPVWAVLEYVGPGSSHLPMENLDLFYMNGMVKIRIEFGFDEPHPRWGRVPVDQALQYARLVLRQTMIPLHQATKRITRPSEGAAVHRYECMLKKYRTAFQTIDDAMKLKNVQHDDPILGALRKLNGALKVIEEISFRGVVNDLAPVLVHLDLQPQNLIFRKPQMIPITANQKSQPSARIHSVLDWEDAMWADPRFDVLMLCRKVCANMKQAKEVWSEYENAMFNEEKTTEGRKEVCGMGPILPWLQLETVHSVTTLLLQWMDLLNGGRNPWETKKDLWGKMQRELARWEGYNP
ncbi:phosphotransferase enzyme family protein [Nitzschia inconspicua]|uniref:Phosphotransferase enzyme family protein n=1 Tax=Nitzschia inconspicua TaxID=303405 RepID=A0A9K3LPN9_9STRA|nr:phosphotransferase enzyme family protein [Nitzschia inconspicua]